MSAMPLLRPIDSEPAAAPLHFVRRDWLLLGLVIALTIAPNLVYWATVPGRVFWFGQSVTAALLVLSPLLLGLSPRGWIALISPAALAAPFLVAYAVATGYPPSVLALQILREASSEELHNFIAPISICSAAACIIGVGLWRLAGRWKQRRPGLGRIPRVAAGALLGIALLKDIPTAGLPGGGAILATRLQKMHPIAPLALGLELKFGRSVIRDRSGVLRNHVVTQRVPGPASELCVLVIGESARRRAFGLYNPAVATNPRLARRDLIVFTDTASCGTATIQSVPILLTGQFPDQGEILPFRHLGLVEAFRLAQFRTSWLSTQEADGEITSFITAFSTNAARREFLNGRLERSRFRNPELQPDGALLAPFRRTLESPAPDRQFVVLHTLGSHMPYLRRYTPEFEKWPVDPPARATMWRWLPPFDAYQREQLEHAYLNTVLYTDWFLDEIISALAARGGFSSLVYIGDHGENDAGAPVMPAGHAVLTDDVTQVPFFIWLSPEFRAQRPGIVTALQANAARKSSMQDLFATVCTLHGLETAAADPARSLATLEYREHPRKVLSLDGQVVDLP